MKVEYEYEPSGAWAYLAALDVHRAKVRSNEGQVLQSHIIGVQGSITIPSHVDGST